MEVGSFSKVTKGYVKTFVSKHRIPSLKMGDAYSFG